MSFLGLLDHLLNFLAPALVVGLLVALAAHLMGRKTRPHHSWLKQAAINCVACGLALLAGLWFFGHDGKMATYAAMVLACGISQWVAAKGWRG